MAETSFTDPKVIEMSRNFVNFIAHQETAHGSKETLVGREKVKLCTDYYTIPCETHTKGWNAVGRFFQGVFGTPTTVFCEPTGKELFRQAGGLSGGELVKKMQEAFSKVNGDKIPLPVWQGGRQAAADGEIALGKSDYKKAIDAFTKLGKLHKASWFKDTSKEGLDKTNEAGQKLLKDALALENVEEKKKALRKIADDFKPLAVAAEAKKELDGIK